MFFDHDTHHVPGIGVLVALVVHLALAATFIVGVATQPRASMPDEGPPGRIEGLVLDGSGVTTTTPSGLRPPVEPIPQRSLPGSDR